jgi:hypothetical protein
MRIRIAHPGFVGVLGAFFLRLLGHTWRIEVRNFEHLAEARALAKQGILSFLHGRFLVILWSHRSRGIAGLFSLHQDGDMVGRVAVPLGWIRVSGSSTRRGAGALRDLAASLRRGLDTGLTIDGPRGPRGVVQQGAIELSRMTGSAVIPVSNAAVPRRLFRSWDRFQLPAPFAKVVVAYGEPFVVPSDADPDERERYRLRLERTLHELTADLDRSLGYRGSDVWPHEDH